MNKLKYAADIKAWIKRAEDDVKWGRVSLKGKFYPQTCFIAQQIAEKALKAYLLSKEKIPPKTHSLPYLLNLCDKFHSGFSSFRKIGEVLDKYYAPARYPDVNFAGEYTEKSAQEALDLALKVLGFVKKEIF